MGQIIPLPLPAAYPATTALDAAECVLLLATRWWVKAHRLGEDPLPSLCNGCQIAGAEDGAFSVDALMTIFARTLQRPPDVHSPHCSFLSNDEKHLLFAAGLSQAGYMHLAREALLHTLLPAKEAEFALVSLRSLTARLAEAGMFFRKRRRPAMDVASTQAINSWTPVGQLQTIR